MDANWHETLSGQHVTVLTQSGSEEKADTGTLLRIADGWLQLVKDNGEMVLIPSTAVRLVKLLDLAHRSAAVERRPELDYPTRSYVAGDTAVRSQAPDDKAIM